MSEATHGLTRATGTGYQSGFGNEFATEALPDVLPVGRNSPQQVAKGLYAEQLSGTASLRRVLTTVAPGSIGFVLLPFTCHSRL